LSQLRSVRDALRHQTLSKLADMQVEEDFSELHQEMELLEVERLRRLGEIERRGTFRRDGHLSVVSWLAHRFKMAWGVARRQARTARALEDMPVAREALESGEVSMSGVEVLVAARDSDVEAFRRSEDLLVEAARIHSLSDLKRVAAYWRQRVEAEHPVAGDEVLRARRRLHASVTFAGMVRVDGDLDPETGETLLTALRAVGDAESRSTAEGDERTPTQRRADALGEICRGWLDLAPRPSVAGERPHVTVTVDADVLARRSSFRELDHLGTSELDHIGPVHPEVARRLACDAAVVRVVMAGRSEPLDVGRRTPVVPPAIRRAVVARDRHCRFPGCDRPHAYCDAHHVQHWADGGATGVGNLLLLCRRHHRMIHEPGGFALALVDGRAVFRRPDGSVLDDRAPPLAALVS
jgi:hypothetical protein